jgi:hypothetical protein
MCAETVHEYGCSYFWKEIGGKKEREQGSSFELGATLHGVAPLRMALPKK